MKVFVCADVRLGALSTENLGVKLSHKWQEARTKKLEELIDQAAQAHASYIALYGQMFGQERVPESVIDSLFAAIHEDAHIRVLAFLMTEEYQRIAYRKDIPENLHLICLEKEEHDTDGNMELSLKQGVTRLQPAGREAVQVQIRSDADGHYVIEGIGAAHTIPSFEPVGFEDAQEIKCGYGIIEWKKEEKASYAAVEAQMYAFQSTELRIQPEEDEREILHQIRAAAARIDPDTFLRLTITGRSAFGLTLNTDALKEQLQNRIFYVEVYDNTIMDIDEEAFENDISLRGEFVRLALQDETLSESERNQLISCGWNALDGKEVSAE